MSETFKIQILTPEEMVAEHEAALVNIPETTGRIGIEARHTPLAASLAAGRLNVVLDNGKRLAYDIAPGVFSFDANLARVLTPEAKRLDDT
ncbi:MAG: hypothetical protein KAG97_04255 [Victivallales bacterium]|nr:hypothetical protein [Victivallales bacterium]